MAGDVMRAEEVNQLLTETRIMAGMRGAFPPEQAVMVARALYAEGIRLFELTLNSEAAVEAMVAVRAALGDDVAVGMVTVLSVADAEVVLDVGADFVVSPAFQPEVVEAVQARGVFMAPGVTTPSEAVRAWAMGVPVLKLFPVGALGVGYFRALYGPLRHMRFMCNGGMTADNAAAFIASGAVGVGMGDWLSGDGTWTEGQLRGRAIQLRQAIAGATQQPIERSI
jgi:2-dehydro-3-deoxyphosphogluconate aldolase / (4S)-4-hydroxy-2-oxoglutarate aldolase